MPLDEEALPERRGTLPQQPYPSELPDGRLTPRQAAFVAEYLVDMNATQAAIRAGYSEDTAFSIGPGLTHQTNIKAAIARGVAQRVARVNVSADTVLQELSLLAQSNVEHYAVDDFGNLTLAEGAPEGAMRAVSSIKRRVRHARDGSVTYEVEFKLWDKPGALKLMGKHAGVKACFDKVEVTGPNDGPVEITEVRRIIVHAHDLHDEEVVAPERTH